MPYGATPFRPNVRRILAILLFLAIAVTAAMLLHQATAQANRAPYQDPVLNLGYRHSERLKVAAAQAAMDVLGMKGYSPEAESFRFDYHRQRLQIQADSVGLDLWAAKDVRHQGLIREIRASVAALTAALDQASGTSTVATGTPKILLLPALERAERAFSNYSASVAEPPTPQARPYLFSGPLLVWWLLVLLLVEAAVLAWLAFSTPARTE